MPLDPRWSTVDPLGDCTFGENAGQATIDIPATAIHDEFTGGFNAPKMLQTSSNTDFDIKVKVSCSLSQTNRQGVGIWCGTDANNFIRFNIHSVGDGTTTYRVYSATFLNGVATTKINTGIGAGANPFWLRVNRAGDVWTFYTSTNGTSWTSRVSFTYAINIVSVGLFALTGVSVSAFTATFDEFIVDDVTAPGIWVDQFETVIPADTVSLVVKQDLTLTQAETVTPDAADSLLVLSELTLTQAESVTVAELVSLLQQSQNLNLSVLETTIITDSTSFILRLYTQTAWITQQKQIGVNDPEDENLGSVYDVWKTQQNSDEPTV